MDRRYSPFSPSGQRVFWSFFLWREKVKWAWVLGGKTYIWNTNGKSWKCCGIWVPVGLNQCGGECSFLGRMTLPCPDLSHLNYLTIHAMLVPCNIWVAESWPSFIGGFGNLLGFRVWACKIVYSHVFQHSLSLHSNISCKFSEQGLSPAILTCPPSGVKGPALG